MDVSRKDLFLIKNMSKYFFVARFWAVFLIELYTKSNDEQLFWLGVSLSILTDGEKKVIEHT